MLAVLVPSEAMRQSLFQASVLASGSLLRHSLAYRRHYTYVFIWLCDYGNVLNINASE